MYYTLLLLKINLRSRDLLSVVKCQEQGAANAD